MIRERRFIEIHSGNMTPGGNMICHVESKGHPCEYCDGEGVLYDRDVYLPGDCIEKKCPVCKGSGVLDAMITIMWSSGRRRK